MAEEFLVSKVILEDNYSANADKVASSTDKMAKSVNDAAEEFEKAERKGSAFSRMWKNFGSGKKKVAVDAVDIDAVERLISQTNSDLKYLTGRNFNISATAKVSRADIKAAKSEAKQLADELQALTGKKYEIDIGMPDTGGLLKGAGAAALAGATAAAGGAKKLYELGSAREQNMVATTHFMGGDTQGAQAMMDWAAENARKTQFGEDEVASAMRRAIQVSSGDTDKAKRLTMLAEDMASLTPGKSIDDAIEALADADMGEMERLKEFGFKGSKEEYDAAGGDLFAMKSTRGQTLEGTFKGGTAAGSDTAAAKIGTLLGTFESSLAGVGTAMLEGLKPVLDALIPVAEKVAPVIGEKLIALGTGFGELMTALQPFTPIFSFLGSIVGGIVSTAFNTVGSIMNDLVIPAVRWVGEKLNPYMQKLGGAAQKISKWFEKASGAVQSFIGGIKDFIGGIGGWISSKLSGGGKAEKNATGTTFFGGGFTQMNENAQGEIVQLPTGSRIYPYQTTRRMIAKELKGAKSSNNVFNVNVDARGSNLTDRQLYALRKGIIKDIKDAFDNAVPA